MSTCHIQQQSILSMVLILRSFLLVINNLTVNLKKPTNKSLFLHPRRTTSYSSTKLTHHLETISIIILYSSSTWLIIKHVKNLTKIHRGIPIRSSITNKEKHDIVGVILLLNVLIHPYLTKNINGFDCETLSSTMSKPSSLGHIRNTTNNTSMLHIITLFI
uniref:Uncharacterized protein C5 n=1 Tax=Cotton leaf curl Gezira virus TaxID=222459 RepID=F8K9T8_9GEMI|nr:hypothetical protein [Cotton leaf curl Gezira virus]